MVVSRLVAAMTRRAGAFARRPVMQRLMARTSEAMLGRYALRGTIDGNGRGTYSIALSGLFGPFVVARGFVRMSAWAIDFESGRSLPLRARIGRNIVAATLVDRPDIVVAFRRMGDLPSRCGVQVEAPFRWGVSLLRLEVDLGRDGWRTIYRNFVVGIGEPPLGRDPAKRWRYEDWRRHELAVAEADLASQRSYAATIGGRPSVTVVVDAEDGVGLDATLASVKSQSWEAFDLVLVRAHDGPEPHRSVAGLETALLSAGGDFTLPLRAGDCLDPSALYALVAAAKANPELDLVYADEESEDGDGVLPFFKPAWSPDTLEAFSYLGAPALYRTAIARDLPAETAYDLALRFTEKTDRIHHVAKVLCRRGRSAMRSRDEDADRRALLGRLHRTGRRGEVVTVEPGFACYDCRVLPGSPEPLVSVVVPTAGRDLEIEGRKLDLIVDCVRSVRERSSYKNLEFVVVANPDLSSVKAEKLNELGCRLVTYTEPVFNVAKKINLGAAQASGDFLLILNDDIEVIAADWIERLVTQAAKPHVGVVGGKLLYPDRTIQHAGVVFFLDNPDHVRRHFPSGDLGYFFSTCAARNYLAVTGACMMARADIFRKVGGYTEALPVNFNDVDFCLKVRQLGLSVVYEPGCEIVHFESASRVPTVDTGEHEYLTNTWYEATVNDPFYNKVAFATAPTSFEVFLVDRPGESGMGRGRIM